MSRFAVCARRLLATASLASCVAASAGVPNESLAQAPVPSRAAPGTTAAPAEPGAELDVYVMTMGQGDELWERFGHNALGIRNRLTGDDVVYNWGMFSFDQPGFVPRFLKGLMLYWMAPFDARQTLLAYERFNRSVTIQELNLTNAQKIAIRDFVEWNSREENKFYRYDYYRDNCSTRVRDAVDKVLGGVIAKTSQAQRTTMTYRDHSLRLMDGLFWARTGIDFGLGAFTDTPITSWEAMFIPMEFQRRIRDIRVAGPNGTEIPLVASEHVLFTATRSPERMEPASDVPLFFVTGVGVALLLGVLAYRTRGRWLAVTGAMVWSLPAGIFGLVLLLLWVATEHISAYRNQNLFFANPLWLVVAALLPFVGAGRGVRRSLLYVVRGCAILAVLGGLVALTPWGQPSGAIAAFAVPLDLAAYFLVLRAVYDAQQRANAALAS